MIRLLIALIIVALLVTAVSRMHGLQQPRDAPPAPDETIIGSQLAPYNKAEQFSEDYGQALGEKRKELDEQIDDP